MEVPLPLSPNEAPIEGQERAVGELAVAQLENNLGEGAPAGRVFEEISVR